MSNWCHIVFRSFAGSEPFHTAGHMTRPRGPRPGGNVQQQLQQHTLPGPGLMPQPFHGAPAVHDYGAQERFLRELQRNPSRWPFHVFCVSVSEKTACTSDSVCLLTLCAIQMLVLLS